MAWPALWWSQRGRRSSESAYDAFISYSHALDRRLTASLQDALHRFAKPWYRLRVLRVFRDDTSLAANPGLWPSIEQALATSRFFILLASREAARSKWVTRETEYWSRHKPLGNVLLVLTDGELVWDEAAGDFDWSRTTALSPSLKGVFDNEPRYIDLRWAHDEEHLSLSHPHFRDGVADLAAPLHGRAKDELFGEDVRQHRRTVRLARSAIASLATLAVLASTAAFIAVDQGNEARAQRDLAEDRARLATSRLLAANSEQNRGIQLPLSLLFSLEALRFKETAEARSSLLAGLQRDPWIASFIQSKAGVHSVAFSPDGKLLAAGQKDASIVLYDAQVQQRLGRPLVGHGNEVTTVAFSPDGKTLASADQDGQILFWDVQLRQRLGRPLGAEQPILVEAVLFKPKSIALSSDGRLLASVGQSGNLTLWDVKTRKRLGEPLANPLLGTDGFGTVASGFTTLAFSPNSRILAVSFNHGIVLWDVRRRRTLGQPLISRSSDAWVLSLAFSPDGKKLASGHFDKTIFLWDVDRHQRVGQALQGHGDRVTSVTFSPDGKTLASGSYDRKIIFWDVKTGQAFAQPRTSHRQWVSSVAFSPDGKTLASGSFGPTVASGNEDQTIILWHAQRSPPPPKGRWVSSIAFSSDGRTMAWGRDDGAVGLRDVQQRLPERLLRGHREQVTGVAFSPDGRTLASASFDRTVILWDVQSGRQRGDPLRGHNDQVTSLAFSPDGKMLASGSAVWWSAKAEDTVILWDVERHRRLSKPLAGHQASVRSVAFSPDGKILASGGDDRMIKLWDVENRREYVSTLNGHANGVTSLAFSPDGSILASGSDDQTIMLWDAHDGRRLGGTLTGHSGFVTTIAFSPDGKTLVSGSRDRQIMLWDVPSRRRLGEPLLGHTDEVTTVAFSADGKMLASGSDDRTIRFWDVDLESWRARACTLANRNLSRAEWNQFVGPDLPYQRTCPQLPPGEGA